MFISPISNLKIILIYVIVFILLFHNVCFLKNKGSLNKGYFFNQDIVLSWLTKYSIIVVIIIFNFKTIIIKIYFYQKMLFLINIKKIRFMYIQVSIFYFMEVFMHVLEDKKGSLIIDFCMYIIHGCFFLYIFVSPLRLYFCLWMENVGILYIYLQFGWRQQHVRFCCYVGYFFTD